MTGSGGTGRGRVRAIWTYLQQRAPRVPLISRTTGTSPRPHGGVIAHALLHCLPRNPTISSTVMFVFHVVRSHPPTLPQARITAKLKELDVYIDEELPDYILVLLGNNKGVQKIQEDLDLFLGSMVPLPLSLSAPSPEPPTLRVPRRYVPARSAMVVSLPPTSRSRHGKELVPVGADHSPHANPLVCVVRYQGCGVHRLANRHHGRDQGQRERCCRART